ncbi:protein TonB [Ectothiorhodospira magna]|uniref:Protein TonB n=1 Tax=Ectothiorhodospira magna TaxID=867345 RepID=A0A1H9AG57_9GAMM|nr:energy transducer TonB [Ectothiorhodospira magna]SEP75575.1 protein TonB [Ectothiorhodospira magna]
MPLASSSIAVDALVPALLLALALHGLVIFGLGFELSPNAPRMEGTAVEVILVHTRTDTPDPKAQVKAQVDQQASGQDAPDGRPVSPMTQPLPVPADDLNQRQATAAVPQPVPRHHTEVITAINPVVPAQRQLPSQNAIPEHHLTDQEWMEHHLNMARFSTELAPREQQQAPRPRIHYVDALSTQSAVEAAYVAAWVRKVEQVGNLNYPDQARRQQLGGSLVLSVLIDQEGQVVNIQIGASSGKPVLDDAARRIVTLAGPFAPFPAEMRHAYDQLMITRTWVFQGNQTHLHSQER